MTHLTIVDEGAQQMKKFIKLETEETYGIEGMLQGSHEEPICALSSSLEELKI